MPKDEDGLRLFCGFLPVVRLSASQLHLHSPRRSSSHCNRALILRRRSCLTTSLANVRAPFLSLPLPPFVPSAISEAASLSEPRPASPISPATFLSFSSTALASLRSSCGS